MKNLVIAIGFLFSAGAALACNPEAQFIGKVTEYSKERLDQNVIECSFKINFTDYKESGVCPLSYYEASETRFADTSCSLKNGDQVSGYLIVKDGQVVIE